MDSPTLGWFPQFLELSKEYILTDPSLSVGFASLPHSNSIYSYSGEWPQEPLWGTLEEYKSWNFLFIFFFTFF